MMVSVNKADSSAGIAVPFAAIYDLLEHNKPQATNSPRRICEGFGMLFSLHICVSESQHQKDPNLVSCVSGSNQDQGSW